MSASKICSTDMTSSTQKILNLKNPNVGKDSIGKLSFLSGLLLLLEELEKHKPQSMYKAELFWSSNTVSQYLNNPNAGKVRTSILLANSLSSVVTNMMP